MIDNHLLISVIVPVYKVEPYLDRCIQSIVNQTYPNLEIILVDDGSPDNCGAICDAWTEKDSRIKVIHKENGGLSDARNAGMAIASGEYIAFVDSDDWVDPQYISAMHHALIEADAEIAACDVFFAAEYIQTESDSSTSVIRICTSEEAIRELISGSGFRAVAWNKLYKRSLLYKEGFPTGRYHEDEFFTYRILGKAARLVFVEKTLYFYFQREGSIMSTFSVKHLDVFDAYLERIDYLRKKYYELYVRDKVQFCISCAMVYRSVLSNKDAEATYIKNRIIEYRKRISFSLGELLTYKPKQLLYILGTRYCMDVFCRALRLRIRRVN